MTFLTHARLPGRARRSRVLAVTASAVLALGLAAAAPAAAADDPPQTSISGHVTNAATGAPVDDLLVQLVGDGDPDGQFLAYTDAGGGYTITGFPAGTWALSFSDHLHRG